MTVGSAADFIRENLALRSPPGLPSIKLHTAHPGSGLRRLTAVPPYWAYPWPGGSALARFLLDDPQTVAGRQVLDFGCGSGLAGIAAAQAGALSVAAFDTDPLARTAAGLNADANGVALAVLAGSALPPPETDVVLAGDVFYSAAVARRTTAFLRRCRQTGVVVLVGDPGREHLAHLHLRPLARYPVQEFGGAPAVGTVFAFEP